MRVVQALLAVESHPPLRPRPGASSLPPLVWKLFIDAHGSTSVPSTEKWSLESSCFTLAMTAYNLIPMSNVLGWAAA